mmetsp:Transcript_1181/g.3328  ORF Transcript_1181/g.3328 Transcript_1181/m.3328 type:complete len:205 (+) Transcript_1181:53-667(+)|eukprot:CAMPEP_0174911918 /NCGR_PEP_ID=MMETSP0167-20121228/78783_1 /TAXON_ID=38298 /ORGANISM="Rhodella maculata, Strain CCMP736" /LENGTH=204 /DNA_ID=CAMNT_0016156527 /DNA_START=18 /DNA_END=632 /DNA_ORIENTATION=+
MADTAPATDAATDAATFEANKAKTLERLKKMGEGVRTGGKGSVRRKRKVTHKNAPNDDKRLQSTIKRLGLNQIPGIEEVNLFKDNGTVVNFQNPKVQASIAANTYVITGASTTKNLTDMLPSILGQMGGDNFSQIQSLMSQLGGPGGFPGGMPAGGATVDDDNDDVPDLVDGATFESKAGASAVEEDNDNVPDLVDAAAPADAK